MSAISNGQVLLNNFTAEYAQSGRVVCDPGYQISSASQEITCLMTGDWSPANFTCLPVDCGEWTVSNISIDHQTVAYYNTTTFGSVAIMTCDPGYHVESQPGVRSQSAICLSNSTWSMHIFSRCVPLECPELVVHAPLEILSPITIGVLNSTVTISCPQEYVLLGTSHLRCLRNGQWSSTVPICVADNINVRMCQVTTDVEGNAWSESTFGTQIANECPYGYSGDVTKRCSADGEWLPTEYNCISKRVNDVITMVETHPLPVNRILQTLNLLTHDTQKGHLLYPSELAALIGVLNVLANDTHLTRSNVGPVQFVSAIRNALLVSSSGLNGSQENKISSEKPDAFLMQTFHVLEKYALNLAVTLEADGSTTIDTNDIVLHVSRITNNTIGDMKYPEHEHMGTYISLPEKSLKGSTILTVVIYRFLDYILPTQISGSRSGEKFVITSEIVSISLDNWQNLDEFVVEIATRITKNAIGTPICTFWNSTVNAWDTDGCELKMSNYTTAICQCSHLTHFAVLMSPFIEPSVAIKGLDIFTFVGCSISIVCLLLTLIANIYVWKHIKNDRVVILMHLSLALLLAYALFLGGVDRTSNKTICTVIAALLHYIYLVVFCVMLVEGIDVFMSIIFVFKRKLTIKKMAIASWVIPGFVVGVSLAATQTRGFGSEKSCWLTVDDGTIWAFVAPASIVILVNIALLVIVIRAVHRATYVANKDTIEKAKCTVRCLLVLLPVTGVSWVLGLLYVDDTMAWVQYLFAVCNSLQGAAIFVFHCLLNNQVMQALRKKMRPSGSQFKEGTTREYVKKQRVSSNESSIMSTRL
ncbi:adhesion G protein-coupled receptor L4-like [Dreissena polymorpha]|nr:adhesion G protein-coupled receptor L4-like [Dreissena polymorpha]